MRDPNQLSYHNLQVMHVTMTLKGEKKVGIANQGNSRSRLQIEIIQCVKKINGNGVEAAIIGNLYE